jgi:hypothetical protein
MTDDYEARRSAALAGTAPFPEVPREYQALQSGRLKAPMNELAEAVRFAGQCEIAALSQGAVEDWPRLHERLDGLAKQLKRP